MNWLLLTILAICSRAVLSIAGKLMTNKIKVSSFTQAVLFTTGGAILTLILAPLLGGLSFNGIGKMWFIAIIMVLAQGFGNVLYYKSLEELDASTTQIAFSTVLIWGTILAVTFLHSSFSLKQLTGIAILLIAILTVQYSRQNHRKFNSSLALILFSAILFAVFQTTSAKLSKTISTGAYLLLAYLGGSIIVGLAGRKALKKDFEFIKSHSKVSFYATLFASAMSLGYLTFSYFAYKHAPNRGVVVVLLTSQVVLSVILAIVFLKERNRVGRKVIGGVLAVIAGFLIKS